MSDFDVIIVGSGPAGYVAAIRAAQLGFKTACVERWKGKNDELILGGTCLNVGCIPSKALLQATHHYTELKHKRHEIFGLSVSDVTMDLKKLIEHKDSVVQKLSSGVKSLLVANKVTLIQGEAKVVSKNSVLVSGTTYQAKNILLATGSRPLEIPTAKFDGKHIVDSTGALSFDHSPKRLGIIGAGVIGLELGSVWARLDSKVTIFEALNQFLPAVDSQIAKETLKILRKDEGLDIRLGSKVTQTKIENNEVHVTYISEDGKEEKQIFDKLIVSVGRIPNSQNLIDPSVGVKIDKRGFIEVDQFCHTGVDGIYAIGDVVRGPMLAHKGSEEGIMVVERLKGHQAVVDYDTIPNVIYTTPEVAWVGKTEDQLKVDKVPYKSGVFPFKALGRALANNDTRGLVKVLRHEKTDKILGVHILGSSAGDLLAQGVITMEFEGVAEDINLTMFAHPTLSEAFHEASLASHGEAIHILNK